MRMHPDVRKKAKNRNFSRIFHGGKNDLERRYPF
jgi:hypothetical protein